MAGCTFSDWSLHRSSFRGSVHNLVVLWCTVQTLVMPRVPARTRMLSSSLNSHSHLQRPASWIWRMFSWMESAKLLSNNTNIWIQWDITQCLAQTQSFYFSGIVSTSYITRNLAGISVIILSHAGQQHPGFYLNLIHMPRQSDSICDNLLHLRALPRDRQSLHPRMQTAAGLFCPGQCQFRGW